MPDNPIVGKPREWDFGDTMRLAVFATLADAGVAVDQAGMLTQFSMHSFKDEPGIFVAWQGWVDIQVNDPATGKPVQSHTASWMHQIIRLSALANFIANDDVEISVVIHLDNLENRLKNLLGGVN
ncbi:MAG: hypothetical protein EOQ39_03700 [Mesorhizobium sp.]|uniref:hypothetical protein n=1 Tax=Mesorhizobium sp. TaxID=1871066 RepID=UPI000FE5056B|nr:hypothetical protein [Mesorhizobium sp.]RWB09014.1 MAG: hypothetical protein EOQ37_05855 [Mesorhizobium sp.]RWB17435.1 MAG: hypothetical protein EOQ39_03700 [Mesorhizobium sp.]